MLYSQGQYANLQDVQFYYETSGYGQPIVLINAGDLDCRMWDDQFTFLAEYYRVFRYDGRGYGRTTTQNEGPFRHTDDLHNLMTLWGIEAAVLLGSSYGAKIALDYTLQNPEQVTKLVLASPGLSGYEFTSEIFGEYSQEFSAAFARNNIEEAVEVSLRMWVDGWVRSSTEVNANVRRRVKEMFSHAYTMLEPAEPEPLEPPTIERLGEIQKPVLIITGECDIPDIQTITEILTSQIRSAISLKIPNTAHMTNMEQAGIFNQQVLNFLLTE